MPDDEIFRGSTDWLEQVDTDKHSHGAERFIAGKWALNAMVGRSSGTPAPSGFHLARTHELCLQALTHWPSLTEASLKFEMPQSLRNLQRRVCGRVLNLTDEGTILLGRRF